MAYCPKCGKRSADDYAKFCGSCGADMKDLGASSPSKPHPKPIETPAPTMHTYGTGPSRLERLADQRRIDVLEKRYGRGSTAELDHEPAKPGEVNVEECLDFRRLLANGLELTNGLSLVETLQRENVINSDKMQFVLPS